jgi:hypothetical protein
VNACSFFQHNGNCDIFKGCLDRAAKSTECAVYRDCINKPVAGSPSLQQDCADWKASTCLYNPTVDCQLLEPCFDVTSQADCNAYNIGNCKNVFKLPNPRPAGAKC